MKKIRVNASVPYNVLIGTGLIGRLGELAKEVCPCERAALITDSNVGVIYADEAEASLSKAGYVTSSFAFEAGEKNKTMDTLADILEHCAKNGLGRGDLIVALGGGVTGDMAGLAAAMYMRGIKYIQVPTSVLAACDSSVGGKTAVDLPQGKNLAGVFYQPALVIVDTSAFDTMPERDYNSGFGEVVKYAMIADETILDLVHKRKEHLEEMISRCIKIKSSVVEKDEFESGMRKILNFGHTVGHAIEKLTGYEIMHGEAVAAGMVMITESAIRTGMCGPEVLEGLHRALDACGIDAYIKREDGRIRIEAAKSKDEICGWRVETDVRELVETIRLDKKAAGEHISMILPTGPGRCTIREMSFEELKEFI